MVSFRRQEIRSRPLAWNVGGFVRKRPPTAGTGEATGGIQVVKAYRGLRRMKDGSSA
jgi:hypothetical protein